MPNDVNFNIDKLDKLQKELLKNYRARVGVLGKKNARKAEPGTKTTETNASIGLKHEMGSISEGIPQRSFLMMPLSMNLFDAVKGIKKEVFQGLTEANMKPFFKKLGVKGEEIVGEAFASGGFGEWPTLSERTIKKKGFDKILVHSTQLENAITSDVKTGVQ